MTRTPFMGSSSVQSSWNFESWDKAAFLNKIIVSQEGRRIVVFNSLTFARAARVTVRVNSQSVVVAEEESRAVVRSQLNPVWEGKSDGILKDEFDVSFRTGDDF